MNHVFGIYEASTEAATAVHQLVRAGFGSGTITVMFHDNRDSRDFARENATKPPRGTEDGASAGEPLDGSWGFMHPATGPSQGALVGALTAMGIPVEWPDGWSVGGRVLLSVQCSNADRIAHATEKLRTTGAIAVGSSGGPAADGSIGAASDLPGRIQQPV